MLEWSLLTDAEVVRNSRCHVRTPKDLTSNAFGRYSTVTKCRWCHFHRECPGHWGHISLKFPVVHPITNMTTFVVAVPPLNIRPPPKFSNRINGLTRQYVRILTATSPDALQKAINEVYGNNLFGESLVTRFKGKCGRIRANIMGRRVNNSARSVITGDPHLKWNQVGVPHSIADALTVKVRVTRINQHVVESALLSADRDHRLRLWKTEQNETPGIMTKVGDVLYRPLEDGDLVILNRQPTLHRNSMLGLEVVRMHHSTIRINPRITKGFNADFDGDEMNILAAQTLESRAEVLELMHIKHHIKKGVRDIQDSKLRKHLDLNEEAFRLFGHSLGPLGPAIRVKWPICTNTMNVHEYKNNIMKQVMNDEPSDSPWRHMIESKSKGNWGNLCAIKGCLGQQFIQGQIPQSLHAWDTDNRESHGFIHSNYTQGLNQREFFFHCMAGREGLIDTAIRTGDVGYKHRRIARFLEELRVEYDKTIRDEHGLVVRFIGASTSFARSVPGTFIGLIAAQCIGEPATQLTLNTFHSAGSLSEITTSGLTRMQELLQWSPKNAVEQRIRPATEHPGEHWTTRATTLDTFTLSVNAVNARHYLNVDMMLRYDTDIHYIHHVCGGVRSKDAWDHPWIEPRIKPECITGIPGVVTAAAAQNPSGSIILTSLSNHDTEWIQHEYSTNPVRTFKHLGIEAARTVWVREMNRICPAEMNSVELLAEYMCITGKPMPCSKRAYEHSNSLRSAAYERAQRVLPDAARANVVERMRTSTEAIAFKQFQLLTRTTLL